MLYKALWYFLIYAFVGWCVEVIFATVDQGKFVNRGFLNGPVCPIYGFGMLLILGCLSPLKKNPILLFLGSVVLCTLLEYITGFLLERFFNKKWWDYSNYPFNIKGYVCLKFSLLWGIGAMLVLLVVHPPVAWLVKVVPGLPGRILLACLGALMATDLVLTTIEVMKLPKKFKALAEIESALEKVSDGIGEKLYEQTEKVLSHEDELKERREELLKSLSAVQRRLLKAFPNLSADRKRLRDYLKNFKRK